MNKADNSCVTTSLRKSTLKGCSWANSGGEGSSLDIDSYLSVDGIPTSSRFGEIENGKLSDSIFSKVWPV